MRFIKWLLILAFIVAMAGYFVIYVKAPQTTAYFINSEREAAQLVKKHIILPDGNEMVYLEGGTGEPLILLHGFGADKDHFTRVAKWLTPHYHVIIPDLIGFGESSHPSDVDYHALSQAERVRVFARQIGITAAHFGGSSMGGQIALAYAAAHPLEVQSLWLIDTAGIWSAPKSELAVIVEQDKHNPLLIRNEDDFERAYYFAMSKPPFILRPILDVLAQTSIKNAKLAPRIFKQITTDSLESRLKNLNTSTLIVWGDEDRIIHPTTAQLLFQNLPHAHLIMMKGIGHLPMIEAPEQTAKDYLYFRFMLNMPH